MHVLQLVADATEPATVGSLMRASGYPRPTVHRIVAALIAGSAWRLLRASAHVLQESAPHGLDVARMTSRLKAASPVVQDVHHVHVWSLTPRDTLLTAHARVGAGTDVQAALAALKQVLVAEFGIEHSTIQIEVDECAEGGDRHCAVQPQGSQRPAA